MSGLGGDDLLENVWHAQGEQVDSFVHPICAHSGLEPGEVPLRRVYRTAAAVR